MSCEHKDLLQKICRVCGSKIILIREYVAPKPITEYSDVLYERIGIRVEEEDENIFPKLLCCNCSRSLHRFKASNSTKFNLIDFVGHNEECQVCLSAELKDTKSKYNDKNPLFLRITNFDIEMKEAGFLIVNLKQNILYRKAYARLVQQNDNILINEVTVFITLDYKWVLQVYDRIVERSKFKALSNLPEELSHENYKEFVLFLSSMTICEGAKGYEDVIASRVEIYNNLGFAKVENENHVQLSSQSDLKYIRHNDCLLFTNKYEKQICVYCKDSSKYLGSLKRRLAKKIDNCQGNPKENKSPSSPQENSGQSSPQEDFGQSSPKEFSDNPKESTTTEEPGQKKQKTSDSAKTNYRYLSKEELIERLKATTKQKKDAQLRESRLHKYVSDLVKKQQQQQHLNHYHEHQQYHHQQQQYHQQYLQQQHKVQQQQKEQPQKQQNGQQYIQQQQLQQQQQQQNHQQHFQQQQQQNKEQRQQSVIVTSNMDNELIIDLEFIKTENED